MSSKALSQEQYNEEFTRLDQELKLAQKELGDTLTINDDFQKNIEQKVGFFVCNLLSSYLL
jgi:hypothetical protein